MKDIEIYKNRIDWLIDKACTYTEADKEKIWSRDRYEELIYARIIIWFNLRKHLLLSFNKIGEISMRDHATIMHGIGVYNNLMDTDRIFNVNASAIEEEFCNKFPSKNREYREVNQISIQVFNSAFRSRESIGKVLLGI
jgi:chromosomal replication initiation ATPase DnaA